MSTSTVYLVSGANRGIGLGLTTTLLKDSSNIVFAGTRDPSKSKELNELAKTNKNLHVVKLTSADAEDNKAAAKTIEETTGQLDVVIANAGISNDYNKAGDVEISQVTDHFTINAIGPLVLFQAVQGLLLKSTKARWALISTSAASMGAPFPLTITAYGSSKAAANFILTRMALEYPSIISLSISPGWVQTDMGNAGAVANGMEAAPLSIDDSVKGVLSVVQGATKESHGKFFDENGKELVW